MLLGIDLPARMVLRAFDDLHTLAEAARALPDVEARLTDKVDELETRSSEVLEAVASAEKTLAAAIPIGRELQERAGEILDRTDRVIAAAHSVTDAADHVAAVLPSLEASAAAATVLADTAEPLQGLVERLGRIADRLPGGFRRGHDKVSE
ncbi:MAG TPA: hypothetical protein VHR88_04375 [Solirubrobacteraceae bacterium]|nr:hypothetical protein [Solirubrobacteraceae bacterium]